MDPGPESKLYSEDYNDSSELESCDWMNSYDSTSNGKEAPERHWPCWTRIQTIVAYPPYYTSLPAVLLPFNTPTFCLALLFFLLLTFGFWTNIPVMIVDYEVELSFTRIREEFSAWHIKWLEISKRQEAVMSDRYLINLYMYTTT